MAKNWWDADPVAGEGNWWEKDAAVDTPALPDAGILDAARDVAAGVLKIGPTAAKGGADILRLATGDALGKSTSDAMERGMKAITRVVGSPRLNVQTEQFGKVMADPSQGLGDMVGYLASNPRVAIDQGISTVGSMILPAGAAKSAATIARLFGAAPASAAVGAAVGTGAAMNAGDTFGNLENQPMVDRYKGAGVSAAVSLLMGLATGGGADGLIARRMAGDVQAGRIGLDAVNAFLKSMGKEGVQEAGEELGNIGGEVVGGMQAPAANNVAKRAGLAGGLGAVMGGGAHVLTQGGAPASSPLPADTGAVGAPVTVEIPPAPAAPAPEAVPVDVSALSTAIRDSAALESRNAPWETDPVIEPPKPAADWTDEDYIGRPEAPAPVVEQAQQPQPDPDPLVKPEAPDAQPAPPPADASRGPDVPLAAAVDLTAGRPAAPAAELTTPEPAPAPAAPEPTTAQKAEAAKANVADIPVPAALTAGAIQMEQAKPGLRPGDIVTEEGVPFANKAAAQKAKKDAGPNWQVRKGAGGFVVRYQEHTDAQKAALAANRGNQREVDTDRDSLFDAIAKLGGVRTDALTKEWGYDPKELASIRAAGIRRIASSKGRPLDSIGEALAELGYLSYDENGKHDLSELNDLFDGELRGAKHFTPQGYENMARAMQEQEWLAQQDRDRLAQLPEEDQDKIEEFHDQYQPDEADIAELQAIADTMGEGLDGPVQDEPGAEEGSGGIADQVDPGPQESAAAGERAGDAAQGAKAKRARLADEPVTPERTDPDIPFTDEDWDKVEARNPRPPSSSREAAHERARRARLAIQRKYEQEADAFDRDQALAKVKAQLERDIANSREDDDVPFSRAGSFGMPAAEVEQAIAADTFGHEVDVYQSLDQAPAYIQEQAEREGAPDVEGFWDPRTNRVALIASNLRSAERAREVARHELIGHYGLENMLGREEMTRLAGRVMKAEQDGNRAIADLAAEVDRTQPGLSPERRAREIMAVMAERNIQNSVAKRILDAVRAFLKKIGFLKADLTDAGVARLLRDAQAYLQEQGRAMVGGEAAPAFSARGKRDRVTLADFQNLGSGFEVDGSTLLRRGRPIGDIELRLDGNTLVIDRIEVRDQGSGNGTIAMASLMGKASQFDMAVEVTSPDGMRDDFQSIGFKEDNGVLRWEAPMFSRAGKNEGDLGDTPQRDPIRARDLFAKNRDMTGRRQNLLGQKAYDAMGDAIRPILAKVKLSNDAPAAFKEMMRQFDVDQTRALSNARRVAEEGQKALTPEQRVLISDIIEKNAIGDVPPEEVVRIATDIMTALKDQAQQLVDLGMAGEDRLIENYLPRAYRNPVLARISSQDQFVSWYQKAKLRINGNRLKSRGLVHAVELAKIPQYKRLGWKISAMADGAEIPSDMLEALQSGSPVPPQYATKDMKVLMWRDFTADERAKMGEIRDGLLRYALGYTETQRDIAIGRLFKAIADHDELSSKVNPGGWAKVPDQEIPGTKLKRYGALSGLFVPPYVRDVIERSTQPKGPLLQMYDTALSFWKEGKTVWNPVSHGNNVVSNVFVMHFAGLNPADPRPWRSTVREYRTKGQHYQEAVDNGLFGHEFASRDIQELFLPELTGELDVETVVASRFSKVVEALKKTAKPVTWYREKMQRAYEFEDQFFKLMIFMDRRKAGASIQDAITDTERYIFNYSDIPEGVEMIKRVYSPFFSYTYKALPMVLHTAMTRPDRLLMPIMLLGGANWLSYALLGADEDKERKGMPEYLQGNTAIGTPKAIRMPFDIGDRPAVMDISRRVPLGDLFDLNNQTQGLPIPAPFMPSHPLLTSIQAVIYNQDTFTGRDLVKKSDTGWEAAGKRADWIYKQIVPNAPFVPGSWNWNKLMNGTANAFDAEMAGYTGYTKAGDPMPLATALLDVSTGTKIRSFDAQRGVEYKVFDLDKQEREIKADMRSAQRNKAMTPEARQDFIAEQQGKLRELANKRRELRE